NKALPFGWKCAKGLAYISIDKNAGDVKKIWPLSLLQFARWRIQTVALKDSNGCPGALGYPSTVMPPVSWTNIVPNNFSFWESAWVRPILVNGSFVCGFHCNYEGTPCLFAISIFQPKLGKFVSGMKLTHSGNLIMFDRNNEMVWQSFDLPTDSLVIGQRLIFGFYRVDTTVVYYQYPGSQKIGQTGQFYAEVTNMTFGLSSIGFEFSFTQLGSDGHLRFFRWVESNWEEVDDFFGDQLNRCDYPLAYRKYGICLEEGCSCRQSVEKSGPMFFRLIDPSRSNLGCYPDNPISGESPQWQSLLELKDTDDPTLLSLNSPAYIRRDIKSCKRACLKNCSCMHALFQPSDKNYSNPGYYFLRSKALSFKRAPAHLNQSLFLKVQNSPIT
ncbi:hypothetical protein SLEP1_g58298, partial [Rubroshorea leprosula]